jgi:hypothetical protein
MRLQMFCGLLIGFALLHPVQASEKSAIEQEIETATIDCDYARAIELLRRYIEQRERQAIPNDILLAQAIRNQASLEIQTGAGKVNRARLWKAIAIDHAAFGRDHPVVAHDYTVIGDVLASEGPKQFREAESYYVQALTILTRAFGPNHPRTLSTFDKLARIAGPIDLWAPSRASPRAHGVLFAQR